jgi:outer membrane biosynthesis protein TonB
VTNTQGRLSHEFHRLDDELSAGVPLPSVDAVIGRAATLNRASMAAAIAVLAVGALGGVTAIAHAGVHPTLAAAAEVIPPAAAATAAPTTTTPPPPVVAPPVTTTVAPAPVRPRTRVVPTRRKTVVPVPTTVAKPPPVVETTTVAPTNSEGSPDSTTTKPTKKSRGTATPAASGATGEITPVDDTSAGTLSGGPATS